MEYIGLITVCGVIFTVLWVTTKILFAYTRFFIVLEGQKLFEAMGSSLSMAIEHLDTTIKLFLSLIVVYVRVVFVVVAMILLPVIIS